MNVELHQLIGVYAHMDTNCFGSRFKKTKCYFKTRGLFKFLYKFYWEAVQRENKAFYSIYIYKFNDDD